MTERIVDLALRVETAEKATAAVRVELDTAVQALAAAQRRPRENTLRFPKPRKTDDKIGMGDITACLEHVPDFDGKDSESQADAAYKAVQRYIRCLFVAIELDRTEKYIDVRYSDEIANLCLLVRKECPYMKYFADDWATRVLIRQYMRNSRATSAGTSTGGHVRNCQPIVERIGHSSQSVPALAARRNTTATAATSSTEASASTAGQEREQTLPPSESLDVQVPPVDAMPDGSEDCGSGDGDNLDGLRPADKRPPPMPAPSGWQSAYQDEDAGDDEDRDVEIDSERGDDDPVPDIETELDDKEEFYGEGLCTLVVLVHHSSNSLEEDLDETAREILRHHAFKIKHHLTDRAWKDLLTTSRKEDIASNKIARSKIAELSQFRPVLYDCCIDSCAAFTGPHEKLEHCPICKKARYAGTGVNRRPRKNFRYLPIIPRLSAFAASRSMAEKRTYRAYGHVPEEEKIKDCQDSGHYQKLKRTHVIIDGKTLPHHYFQDPRDTSLGPLY
ncbi:hypothetical protein PENSPDRAFT_695215 [Peniophora sp. CONT]|nr:hypothetical protein PENSPDRAFT_695215 [Peniophora sp. CONT]